MKQPWRPSDTRRGSLTRRPADSPSDSDPDSDWDRTKVYEASSPHPGSNRFHDVEQREADRAVLDHFKRVVLQEHGADKAVTHASIVAASQDLSCFLNDTCADICAVFLETMKDESSKKAVQMEKQKKDQLDLLKRLESAKDQLNEKTQDYAKAQATRKAHLVQCTEEIQNLRLQQDRKWQALVQEYADLSKEQTGKVDLACKSEKNKIANMLLGSR